MRGRQITSLSQLVQASLEKRAVIGNSPVVWHYQPAAWIICMQAIRVHWLIVAGLWIYEKEAKKK